jgi:hypothetical protein
VFDANTRLEAVVDTPAPLSDATQESSAEAWYNKPAAQALVDAKSNSKAVKDDVQWTKALGSKGVLNSQNAGGEVTLSSPSLSDDQKDKQIGKFDDSERYKEIDIDDLMAMQATAKQTDRRKRRAEKKRVLAKAKRDVQASLSLDDKDPTNFVTNPTNATSAQTASSSSSVGRALTLWLTVLLSITAGLAAAAQLLLISRLAIADSLPMSKPVLSQACVIANCTIEPAAWLQPLSLDALTLSKSSTAAPSNNGLQTYRMLATVRNSSQLRIQKPDIELTISHVNGAVIARKTIAARSLTPDPNATINPGADWQIDAVLQLDEQTVGYTARVIYSTK